MTGLLLATLLNLSPGIQLADNVAGRTVALGEALQFAAWDAPKPSIDAMTRDQLAVELRRLDESKPSLVGPIVLLSVGGALGITGAVLVVTQLGSLSSSGSWAFLGYMAVGLGAIMVTVGVILAIIGAIKLPMRIVARGSHAEETDEVRQRMDALDQSSPPPPPPGPDLVPPPPPPPPQANRVVPAGMQTVMTF